MPQYGGAAEKCAVCAKTVYLAEKIVVEDKEDKKTFHKNCLKCSHCKCTLSLGNYASMQGVFYCKPHFKQLFATKGNYDEGFGKDKHTKNWTPQAVSAPASFVPVDKDEPKEASKTATPSSIASKFGKGAIGSDKCHVCNKTVYATEKTVIEDKEDKKVFHKTCLKCAHCNVIVTLGNYASMQGTVYCKPHFKQLFAQKGNYDEGFGKEKTTAKWEPQVNTAPTSFVPVDKDSTSSEKRAAPEGVASRFKGTAANTEKCQGCGKTVYATERIVVEDKEDKQTYHKTCLKCSHCNVVLTLGNYASMHGTMYCKPHFKQLFAAKGNYDEGFGKEKHTKKWQEGDDTAAPSAAATATTPREDNKKKEEEEREKENRKREEEAAKREEEAALEKEIEREKQAQKEREEEREREEAERAEREEREREERETRRREEKEREEKEEREREEREEREREEREKEERERLEAEQASAAEAEKEEEPAHDHEHEHSHDHDHEHHDHEHSHSHDHEHEHEHAHSHEEEPAAEEEKREEEPAAEEVKEEEPAAEEKPQEEEPAAVEEEKSQEEPAAVEEEKPQEEETKVEEEREEERVAEEEVKAEEEEVKAEDE